MQPSSRRHSTFGQLVAQYRLERGMSLQQLAEDTQISTSYLRSIESENINSPSFLVGAKLCSVLQIPLSVLYGTLFDRLPDWLPSKSSTKPVAAFPFSHHRQIAILLQLKEKEISIVDESLRVLFDLLPVPTEYTFGHLLREYRERKKWTTHQASVCTGVPASQINRFEKNIVRNPHMHTVLHLAETLEIPVELIFKSFNHPLPAYDHEGSIPERIRLVTLPSCFHETSRRLYEDTLTRKIALVEEVKQLHALSRLVEEQLLEDTTIHPS